MAQKVAITAESRPKTGKGAARQLRMVGKVPAVIYGHGRAPQSLTLSHPELEKALTGIAAESVVIDLSVDGVSVKALIREIQRHPTRSKFLHLDFYEIHAGEKITLSVPVLLEGVPDGVRNGGGVLDQVLREVEIEVDPADIPDKISVDVTHLGIHHSLHVRDLKVERATFVTDPDDTVCVVVPPRTEEAPAPVAGEITEEPAEPELIRKPKPEEEGEGEASEKE